MRRLKLILAFTLAFGGCVTRTEVVPSDNPATALPLFSTAKSPPTEKRCVFVSVAHRDESELRGTGSATYYVPTYNGPDNSLRSLAISTFIKHRALAIFDEKNLVLAERGKFRPFGKNSRCYLISMTLSEFGEMVEGESSGIGDVQWTQKDSTGQKVAKTIVMIPMFWLGQATLLPTSYESRLDKGVVAIDTQIIDIEKKIVLTSFSSQGTFSAKSVKVSGSAGFGGSEKAKSLAENALRAALSQTAEKILTFFAEEKIS